MRYPEGADFVVARVDKEKRIAFIVDRGGAKTITNDAVRVVATMQRRCPDFRFVYRDTMGNWDELLHTGSDFNGFKPCPDRAGEWGGL